jgi:HPt (histidine-containing phosphotransfer) domain-containing protein
MLKRRSRIVSFRLSDEEYKSLKSVSASCGARSVSEFTRSVACHVNAGGNGDAAERLEDSLRTLNEKMEMLDRRIQTLADELRDKSATNPQNLTSDLKVLEPLS